MWAFFLSLINLYILCYVLYLCVKKHIDTAILYYCLISLYFINIPLFYDALMVVSYGVNSWENSLMNVNMYWSNGSLKNIEKVALYSLIFNALFLLSYYIICRNNIKENVFTYRPLNKHILSPLSWKTCFLFSFLGLVIFMVYNNISSFSMMNVGDWYEDRSQSRILSLLASLFVPLMSVGVIRMLFTKDFIRGGIILTPVLIIGFFTGARSQIIPIVFYFLFYYLWAYRKFKLRNFLLIGIVTILFVYVLTVSREEMTALYPIYKDWAYIDLFFVFDSGREFSTYGLNTLTMIFRDFMPQKVEDITTVVADAKFGVGWGTLHPSILGWAYVDLQEFFWILAIYLGSFVAIFDRLRHRMPTLIYLLFLSYEFSFLAISIRGSMKFAYSQLFYPMLILLALYILNYFKIINCRYNENSSSQQR